MYKNPIVICGFPGVGKTTLFKGGLNCTDTDHSVFDVELFPKNFIDYIKALIANAEHDFIFVSTHASVRRALREAEIPFKLVYPRIDCKEEYLQRYRNRGSSAEFIKLMNKEWANLIVDCAEQTNCDRMILKPGEYLLDVLNK